MSKFGAKDKHLIQVITENVKRGILSGSDAPTVAKESPSLKNSLPLKHLAAVIEEPTALRQSKL